MSDVVSVFRALLTIMILQTSVRGFHYVGYQHDARSTSQNLYPNATETLYSPWTSWSACSHTCGTGISMRSRTCNKRFSRNEESICLSDSMEHKICKLQACPPGTPDPRSLQCSQYNNRLVAGQRRKVWVPTSDGSNPCELRCLAEGLVSGFGKVADGTPCSKGICLDGRCLKVGCDDKLGSGSELDMCGICGGHNITCVHYKDIFSGQLSVASGQERRSSYVEVVVIPVGARNVEIRQHIGQNILAIRDRNTAVLYHGNERLPPNRKHIAGTVLTYVQEDENRTEVLRTVGPTIAELYVLVLLRERNQGIYYQYWIPLNQPRHTLLYGALPTPPSTTTRIYRIQTTRQPYWSPPTDATPRLVTYPRSGESKPTTQPTPPFSSPTAKLNYGPKRRGLVLPQLLDTASSSQTSQHFTAPDRSYAPTPVKNNLPPVYHPNYRTQKPVYNYYEKFRNVSYKRPVSIYRKPDYFPQQTQRDSSISNGVEVNRNILHNSIKPEKEKKIVKYENFTQYAKNPSRWKYNINGKSNESSRWRYSTTPVSIAVLPLPDAKDHNKIRRGKRKGGKHQPNSRLTRGESCPPCQRVKDQTKHFCTSDFVIRASVVGYDFIHGETRYELEVLQSFKNTFALLSKEYIWAPDTCRCPKLRIGKEYLLMGRSDDNYKRNESRLLVDRSCFVRNYNHKYGRRLLRLRKNQAKKCSAKVS